METYQIVLCVVGGVIALGLIIWGIVFAINKNKKKSGSTSIPNNDSSTSTTPPVDVSPEQEYKPVIPTAPFKVDITKATLEQLHKAYNDYDQYLKDLQLKLHEIKNATTATLAKFKAELEAKIESATKYRLSVYNKIEELKENKKPTVELPKAPESRNYYDLELEALKDAAEEYLDYLSKLDKLKSEVQDASSKQTIKDRETQARKDLEVINNLIKEKEVSDNKEVDNIKSKIPSDVTLPEKIDEVSREELLLLQQNLNNYKNKVMPLINQLGLIENNEEANKLKDELTKKVQQVSNDIATVIKLLKTKK